MRKEYILKFEAKFFKEAKFLVRPNFEARPNLVSGQANEARHCQARFWGMPWLVACWLLVIPLADLVDLTAIFRRLLDSQSIILVDWLIDWLDGLYFFCEWIGGGGVRLNMHSFSIDQMVFICCWFSKILSIFWNVHIIISMQVMSI